MSNIFYPKRSVFVPASKPHADNTQYKVSIGEEDRDGELQSVIKVQMVYGGKIAGRKSPSYPYGSTDAERVSEAIKRIREEYENMPDVEYMPALPSTTVSKRAILWRRFYRSHRDMLLVGKILKSFWKRILR